MDERDQPEQLLEAQELGEPSQSARPSGGSGIRIWPVVLVALGVALAAVFLWARGDAPVTGTGTRPQ